jgi:predicted deacylase
VKKKKPQDNFEIGGVIIPPGTSKTVHLPLSMISHHAVFDLTIRVVHGKRPGKTLFISSTLHGDELNGIEIIRRILRSPISQHIQGTLIAIPIVNTFGFLTQSRYLLDRRDLNRNFPGSKSGSTTAQLAHLFLKEIVKKCTHGIDLHTGSNNRINLPQVRCNTHSQKSFDMALSFGAPLVLKATSLDGSLREAAEKMGIPTLTYEGGEALRFNEFAIRTGVQGIFRVMAKLGMIPCRHCVPIKKSAIVASKNRWLRAPITGIFHCKCFLGTKVFKGDILGHITDVLGLESTQVIADLDGIIIGMTQLPLVFRGDALFNIAWVPDPRKAEKKIEEFVEEKDFALALDDPNTY